MDSREFFNSMAEKWDSSVKHDDAKIRRILDIAGIGPGSAILDAGTGTGVMVPYLRSLAGKSGRIVAVDISEKMINVARRKYSFENVEFIVADMLEAGLPENYFDCVMCYSVFPHFPDKKAAVARLARCLKKGGKLVVCHSQSRDAINKLHMDAPEAVKSDRLPDVRTIERFFTEAGLKSAALIDNDEMFVAVGIRQN